jgi:dienelactone hydrolase
VRDDVDVHVIPAMTHGRILVRAARAGAARGLVVGFHGYKENAPAQMERLLTIPGAAAWTLVSVQALHRFYRGRTERGGTEEVVASWMTREDREAAIADNVAYVDAALDAVPHDDSTRIVYAGFSQGVAMAFRAALRGRRRAAGVIAVGGDVPPELLSDREVRFPPLVLARGRRDDWFTQAKFDAEVASLTARHVTFRPFVYEGVHEWNEAVSSAAGEFLAALN